MRDFGIPRGHVPIGVGALPPEDGVEFSYLAGRGIHDRDVIEQMGIGYAPGACLRGCPAR